MARVKNCEPRSLTGEERRHRQHPVPFGSASPTPETAGISATLDAGISPPAPWKAE